MIGFARVCVYFKVWIRVMESEVDSQLGSASTSIEEHVVRLVCEAGWAFSM